MHDPRSTRRLLALATLIGATLLWLPFVRHTILSLVRLPFAVVTTVVTSLAVLPRVPRLAQDNATLRRELLQRELELAQAREALRHAGAMQELAGSAPASQGIVASVIGRSTVAAQQTVLINRGTRDGLAAGAVVVDAYGLVGRMIEVQPSTSLVLLLTDPESRVAALVERSRETGLVVGRLEGGGELIHLAVDADIEPGDRVVTAGLDGPFPKGLLLGTVVSVSRDEHVGTARAVLALAGRVGRLEEVLCISEAAAP